MISRPGGKFLLRWEWYGLASFNRTEVIARPVPEVFAFCATVANLPRAVKDLVSAELLTPGPVRVGTRYRGTYERAGGTRDIFEVEISEFEADRALAFKRVAGPFTAVYRVTFQPHAQGTRLDLLAEVTAVGPAEADLPRLIGHIEAADGDFLNRFKAAIEG